MLNSNHERRATLAFLQLFCVMGVSKLYPHANACRYLWNYLQEWRYSFLRRIHNHMKYIDAVSDVHRSDIAKKPFQRFLIPVLQVTESNNIPRQSHTEAG